MTIIGSSLIVFGAFFFCAMTGFGSALISVPLLVLFYELKFVAPLVLLFEMSLRLILLPGVARDISLKHAGNVVVGVLAGSIVGIYYLMSANNNNLRTALAITVLLFSVYMYFSAQRSLQFHFHSAWGVLIGLVAGFFGGAFNTSGPIVVAYFASIISNKTELRATLTGLFLITAIWKLGFYCFYGLITKEVLSTVLLLAPAFLLGTYLGNKTHTKISEKTFRLAIAAVLLVSGSMLLLRDF